MCCERESFEKERGQEEKEGRRELILRVWSYQSPRLTWSVEVSPCVWYAMVSLRRTVPVPREAV